MCSAYEQLEVSRCGGQVQSDGAVAGGLPCRGPKTGDSGSARLRCATAETERLRAGQRKKAWPRKRGGREHEEDDRGRERVRARRKEGGEEERLQVGRWQMADGRCQARPGRPVAREMESEVAVGAKTRPIVSSRAAEQPSSRAAATRPASRCPLAGTHAFAGAPRSSVCRRQKHARSTFVRLDEPRSPALSSIFRSLRTKCRPSHGSGACPPTLVTRLHSALLERTNGP